MEAEDFDFEKYFIYRLIQVVYYFSLFTCTLFFILGLIGVFCGGDGWVLIISIISYLFINVMREGLIYLFFGKKLSWNWLLTLIGLIKKINMPIEKFGRKIKW